MTDSPEPAACPESFVAFAEDLAEAAREVTRRYFRTPVAVDAKADASPVTVADRETEARLRALIARRFPEHGLIGEEHGRERTEAEYVWVLDPIDGTKAFITGNPLFGTLIALTRAGRPLLGVIDMPILGERWIGAAGRPTEWQGPEAGPEAGPETGAGAGTGGRRPVRSRACPRLSDAVLQTTSPEMFAGAEAAGFAALSARVRLTRFGGDCFSYAQLASGFVDLVVEAGLEPYDFMALLPVIEGAGGAAVDWQGAPLGLHSDGHMLAAGDPALLGPAGAFLKSS